MYKTQILIKFSKIVIILVIFLTACKENNKKVIKFEDNKKYILTYNSDNKIIQKDVYFENGNLEKVIKYSENKITGNYLEYYENGKVKFQATYKDGFLDGVFKSYYQNGKIKSYNNYKYGHLNGVQKIFSKKNYIEMTCFYRNDTNLSYTEFDSNGKIINNYYSIECKSYHDTIKLGETYKVKFKKYGTFGIDDISIIGYIQAFQNSMKEIKFDENEAEYSFQLKAKGSFIFVLESIVNKKDTVRECSQIFFILPK